VPKPTARSQPRIRTATALARAALLGAALAVGAASAPVAADAPPVKIGFIFSYTGANAETAKYADAALDAYVHAHGDTVAGRKIQIIKRDDTGIAPEVARRLAQELVIGEHVDFLAGSLLTPNAIAIAGVSTAAHVPFLIVNAGTSGILAKQPYTVRFGFTNAQVTQPLAQWAVQNGLKRVYAIYQNYGPGVETTEHFQKAFTTQGGTFLGAIGVPFQTTDYAAYVQRLRDAAPQAVFAFINGGPGIEFLKTAAQGGFAKAGIRIISAVELVDPNDLPIAGDAAIGTVSAINYLPQSDSKINRAFVAQFRASYDRTPNYIAVAVYDVLDAIYRTVAAQKGELDANKSLDVLRNLSFESPRGPIRIDPKTRDIIQNIYIRRIERSGGGWAYRQIGVIPMVKDATEDADQ
jgi:branched-chain amino acid transport system substrate-binding protein